MNYSYHELIFLMFPVFVYYSSAAVPIGYTDPDGSRAVRGSEKRSADIIGVSVLIGMRAVRDLLAGATRIPSASPVRQFVKSGGYEKAVEDFYSIHPSFVHSFELSSDTFVTAGRAGDRQLILRHTRGNRKPTLEVTQMRPIPLYPPDRQSIMSKISDEITYVD